MENEIHFNITSFKFRPKIWMGDVLLTAVLLLTSLYLVIALLYHQTKIEKKHQEVFQHLSLEKKYNILSKYTCVSVAFVSLIRNINGMGLLTRNGSAFLSNETIKQTTEFEIACEILPRLAVFLAALGSGLVYLFLWFRQSIFYVQPHLIVLNNKCVRVFSFGVLIMYLMFGLSLFVAYLISFRYDVSESGFCWSKSDAGSDRWSFNVFNLFFTVGSILMQIALLGLFINPMLKRTLWGGNHETERTNRLMRRVKKAIVLACICFVTDIFAYAAILLLYEKDTNRALFPHSINLVINCLVTIACFDRWKETLWPWNLKSHAVTFQHTLNKTSKTRSLPLSKPATFYIST